MRYHLSNTWQTAMANVKTILVMFHDDTVLIGSNVIYISVSLVLIYTILLTRYYNAESWPRNADIKGSLIPCTALTLETFKSTGRSNLNTWYLKASLILPVIRKPAPDQIRPLTGAQIRGKTIPELWGSHYLKTLTFILIRSLKQSSFLSPPLIKIGSVKQFIQSAQTITRA